MIFKIIGIIYTIAFLGAIVMLLGLAVGYWVLEIIERFRR